MSAQIISRSQGRSATASSAYRSGEKIRDERTGEIHNYTRKKGVSHAMIFTPDHVGEWAKDREQLWNKVELAENRKNSQVAREINVAIPIELNKEEGRELVQEYAQKNFVSQGMIADICIHDEGGKNPHAHIMLPTREADKEGFTKKNRDWNNRTQLENWREEWAHECNQSLERAGSKERVDHRTLEAQGINREPTIHVGVTATEIERRGELSERGQENKEIIARNQELARLKEALQDVTSEIEKVTGRQVQEKELGQKTIGHLINKRLEERAEAPERKAEAPKSIGDRINKPQKDFSQAPKSKINYHDKMSEDLFTVITHQKDTAKYEQIKGLMDALKEDAKPKNIEDERKKDPQYQKAKGMLDDRQNKYDQSVLDQRETAEKIKRLGMLGKGQFALGLHELNKEEKEREQRKQDCFSHGKQTEKEVHKTVEQVDKKLKPIIEAHNKRALLAQDVLEKVNPIFNQYEKSVLEAKERVKSEQARIKAEKLAKDLEQEKQLKDEKGDTGRSRFPDLSKGKTKDYDRGR